MIEATLKRLCEEAFVVHQRIAAVEETGQQLSEIPDLHALAVRAGLVADTLRALVTLDKMDRLARPYQTSK